jgi:hypothetical protein
MLSERTAQAEQRPKLARFGEMVRIIAPARSSAGIDALSPGHGGSVGDIFHSSGSTVRWLIQIKLAGD